MTSLKTLILPLIVLFPSLVSADELFPQPAELQRDVDFWRDVFTVYGSDEGVLHDNRNLAIVYQRLAIPEKLSRRERQRRVSKHRKDLQAVLRTLASGKRDNLTVEELRVLSLWPADASNSVFRDAVGRIRYQQGLRERFEAGLVRSGLWRDHVNKEFSALNVPIEIAALPHVESSYDTSARSHVGASGIWQFTRSTGRRFMRVDHVIDDRNDPFIATQSAARLMAYNYSLTGNWPMAITAYNHGLGGVRRAMKEFGATAYVDILRNYKGRTFGFASRNFYVAFLAAKEVDQNVEKYFPGLTTAAPITYSTASLPDYVSAKKLSAEMGISTQQLARHNLSLQETVWQESKYLPKGFVLRYPSNSLSRPLIDIVAALPDSARFSKQLPDMYHRVARGDTVSQIARTYGTRVSILAALNGLNNRRTIRVGQQLRLPAAGPAPQAVAAVTTEVIPEVLPPSDTEALIVATPPEEEIAVAEMMPGTMADVTVTEVAEATQTSLLSDPSDYSVSRDFTIEVQPLETLGHFGDWLEIKTQRLRDINGLAFRTPVAVGQRIKLDLRQVDAKAFEVRRIAYHRTQQDSFFKRNVISGVVDHEIKSGESIWILSLRQHSVPIWLFRQYNPGVDLHNIRPGTTVQIPLLQTVEQG